VQELRIVTAAAADADLRQAMTVPSETEAEFATRYAHNSRVSPETLVLWGRYPEPCECGEAGCTGWRMGYQHEDAIIEDRTRSVTR
jgi:hypothetical protein